MALDELNKMPFGGIHPSNENVSIQVLKYLGLTSGMVEKMAALNWSTIASLRHITRREIHSGVSLRHRTALNTAVEMLQSPFAEVLETVLSSYFAKHECKFLLRRAEGETLQEIGDSTSLTRERVRQIVRNRVADLTDIIIAVLPILEKEGCYFAMAELGAHCENEEQKTMLRYALIESEVYEYLSFADVFITHTPGKKGALPRGMHTGKQTEKRILQLITEQCGVEFNISEKYTEIIELMRKHHYTFLIEPAEILQFLLSHGFRQFGEYLISGLQSYAYLCEKVIARHFTKGIRLYDRESMLRLRELTTKRFGNIDLPDNDRALASRLLGCLVLCDRGMYISKSCVNVDPEILDLIHNYIENSEDDSLYYSSIFSAFEERLRTTQVSNYNYLHGIIKLYYPDEYDFQKDYLVKKETGGVHKPLSERLKDYLDQKGELMARDELWAAFPGFSDTWLTSVTIMEPGIMNMGNNMLMSAGTLKTSILEYNKLSSLIEDIMSANHDYCSDGLLYEAVNKTLQRWAARNNIESPFSLFSVIEYHFAGIYEFRRPHILRKGAFTALPTDEIALQLMGNPDVLHYFDYNSFCERMRWSIPSTHAIFKKLESRYYRVSQNDYVRKEMLEIEEKALIKIRDVLRNAVGQGWLATSDEAVLSSLPVLAYSWNAFLLQTVVEVYNLGYKCIQPTVKDRRYSKGIIVPQDSTTSYPL
jgi:hypothetical protein